MTRARQLLCAGYGAMAALALIATWRQNIAYFGSSGSSTGFIDATARFWRDTLVNPASTSITVDIFMFGLAATVLMVIEARKLGIRFVWLYVLLGFLVAISVAFPLYLIARERRLAASASESAQAAVNAGDAAGLVLLGAANVALCVWTIFR